jgi:hypothetical protein
MSVVGITSIYHIALLWLQGMFSINILFFQNIRCLNFANSVYHNKLLSLEFMTESFAILQVTQNCYNTETKGISIGRERS